MREPATLFLTLILDLQLHLNYTMQEVYGG